jgi:hypothetical protein
MEEAIFYIFCIIALSIWTRWGANKYIYNYDSYDYTKNMD